MTETKTLSMDDLAERWGVDRATVSRMHKAKRLPEPITGPRKRGIGWSEQSIRVFEQAGFMAPADFRANVAKIRAAEAELTAIAKDNSLAADVRAMARAGATLLNNPRVPLRMRLDLLERFLTRLDWSDVLRISNSRP